MLKLYFSNTTNMWLTIIVTYTGGAQYIHFYILGIIHDHYNHNSITYSIILELMFC